jgi:aspartate racemase
VKRVLPNGEARFAFVSVVIMKMLGLLGGMSWESSIEYERAINTIVRERLGGTASADLLIRSFNFEDIEKLQETGRWDEAGRTLAAAAKNLVAGGAEAIVICTNTMHMLADQIQTEISVPLIHIADVTAHAVRDANVSEVALLGTRYTMEHDFYAGRLRDRFGLTVIVPDEPDRTRVHDIIYEELVRGVVTEQSRSEYLDIIARCVDRGAKGVIAGCTEVELLIQEHDVSVPYFPTARLHAMAAADFMLG